MLGHGLGALALGRRGPKRYISTSLLVLDSALMGLCCSTATNVLKKGVFDSRVPHDTAVPTLIIVPPTHLKVSAACPGKHSPRPAFGRSSAGSVTSLVPKS
eukprot:356034-Chlamydomonas_euryale.AAC.1